MLALSNSILDSKGKPVSLATNIARGGEGSVYDVANRPNLVVKLYHNHISDKKVMKIKEMVKLNNSDLLKCTTWPIDTLHGSDNSIIGLLMPKISGYKEIHKLYGPKTRLTEFPTASYRFLLHTASNLARAFAQIHSSGQVIGDVNHSNILVSQNATVVLIDCDSFQIITKQGKFFCEVGVSTHQPPEFQELSSFKCVTRTQNHDNFGLAVLIFQLLFMGRHPFSGKYLGKGEMPLERAIKEFRFAYGLHAKKREMEAPPGTLPLSFVTEPLVNLFEGAFAPEGIKEHGRPTAKEWFQALDQLEKQTVQCPFNQNHNYFNSTPTCPWCQFERKTGLVLFKTIIVSTTKLSTSPFNLELIRTQIEDSLLPTHLPNTPKISDFSLTPSEQGIQLKKQKLKGFAIGLFINIVLIGTSLLLSVKSDHLAWIISASLLLTVCIYKANTRELRIKLETLYKDAENRYNSTLKSLNTETNATTFNAKKDELKKAYDDYKNLSAERNKRLKLLQKNIYELQLISYLQTKRLETASISGIGPSRKTILQSFGIETAADIDRFAIQSIPGFGKKFTDRLLNWRSYCEKNFKFNASKGVPHTELLKIEQEIAALKTNLENRLSYGVQELSSLSDTLMHKRSNIASLLQEHARDFAQAKLNLNA
jgi:DNA-binding helix-hairpin-helix protein with protein kinase domain